MTPFDQFVADFQSKKVLVMGLGLLGSNLGVTKLLVEVGAQVHVTDIKSPQSLQSSLDSLSGLKLEFTLGKHDQVDFDWAEVIVKSASVPDDHPLLEYARSLKKPIVMDTPLFMHYAHDITSIGVTGTRGKSTTTHMINLLFSQLPNTKILMGGNIKDTATLPLLKSLSKTKKNLVILELSSWQLHSFHQARISPNVAVLTNLYPDHLNRYPNLEAYYADKQAIYQYQTKDDAVFFNREVKIFHSWASQAPGKVIWYDPAVSKNYPITLLGSHNLENAAAAIAVARYFQVPSNAIKNTMASLKTLPYRLEPVRTLNQITFINDTTSTTPIATQIALKSLPQKPILILGGSDKKLPVKQLAGKINQHARMVILLSGNGTDRIKPLIKRSLIHQETGSLKTAVKSAFHLAHSGDVVLFSPGFTSFGLFENEFDRGDAFNREVKAL